jgi:hypothetical protein
VQALSGPLSETPRASVDIGAFERFQKTIADPLNRFRIRGDPTLLGI